LRIIIWDVPLLLFASFSGNMTTIVGEERSAARIYAGAAVTNILLNLVFIPLYGYMGASVVTVVTDLVAGVPFYILSPVSLACRRCWTFASSRLLMAPRPCPGGANCGRILGCGMAVLVFLLKILNPRKSAHSEGAATERATSQVRAGRPSL
jgi:O-antigen/teichoic acid export membrane protein